MDVTMKKKICNNGCYNEKNQNYNGEKNKCNNGMSMDKYHRKFEKKKKKKNIGAMEDCPPRLKNQNPF